MRTAGYTLEARHEFLPRQHFLVFFESTFGSAVVTCHTGFVVTISIPS